MKNFYSLSMALTAFSLAMTPMASEAAKMAYLSKSGEVHLTSRPQKQSMAKLDENVPHFSPAGYKVFKGSVRKYYFQKNGDQFDVVDEPVCLDQVGRAPVYEIPAGYWGPFMLDGADKAFDCKTTLQDIGDVSVRLSGFVMIHDAYEGASPVGRQMHFGWYYNTVESDKDSFVPDADLSGYSFSTTTDLGLTNLTHHFSSVLSSPFDNGKIRSKELFSVKATIQNEGL